jgi:hypothetical protein
MRLKSGSVTLSVENETKMKNQKVKNFISGAGAVAGVTAVGTMGCLILCLGLSLGYLIMVGFTSLTLWLLWLCGVRQDLNIWAVGGIAYLAFLLLKQVFGQKESK